MSSGTIPDDKLGKALGVLYNVWFDKWRRKSGKMTDMDWQQLVDELDRVVSQGEYPAVRNLGMALLRELEARDRGGYRDEEK